MDTIDSNVPFERGISAKDMKDFKTLEDVALALDQVYHYRITGLPDKEILDFGNTLFSGKQDYYYSLFLRKYRIYYRLSTLFEEGMKYADPVGRHKLLEVINSKIEQLNQEVPESSAFLVTELISGINKFERIMMDAKIKFDHAKANTLRKKIRDIRMFINEFANKIDLLHKSLCCETNISVHKPALPPFREEYDNPLKGNENGISIIAKFINWKSSPEEFVRHIDILAKSGYVKIIAGKITFINPDAYKDIIALFYYWFETKNIIPSRRDKTPLIPQKIIAATFYRLVNDEPQAFNKAQIGSENNQLIEESRNDRIENFRRILK